MGKTFTPVPASLNVTYSKETHACDVIFQTKTLRWSVLEVSPSLDGDTSSLFLQTSAVRVGV